MILAEKVETPAEILDAISKDFEGGVNSVTEEDITKYVTQIYRKI